jgi:hypothetical protein
MNKHLLALVLHYSQIKHELDESEKSVRATIDMLTSDHKDKYCNSPYFLQMLLSEIDEISMRKQTVNRMIIELKSEISRSGESYDHQPKVLPMLVQDKKPKSKPSK